MVAVEYSFHFIVIWILKAVERVAIIEEEGPKSDVVYSVQKGPSRFLQIWPVRPDLIRGEDKTHPLPQQIYHLVQKASVVVEAIYILMDREKKVEAISFSRIWSDPDYGVGELLQ